MPGLPGVIGHLAPKHVAVELVEDPEECKHLLKMVDHNAKEYQRRLESVMNKIVQVNNFNVMYFRPPSRMAVSRSYPRHLVKFCEKRKKSIKCQEKKSKISWY